MTTSYPTGLDSFTNPEPGDDTTSPSHAGQHSDANDAIEAIEAELGLTPSGAEATVVARLDGVDTSVAGNASDLSDHEAATTSVHGIADTSVLVVDSDIADVVETTDTSVSGWSFVLDEDDMSSDDATKVPTQQSVKAYADAGDSALVPVEDETGTAYTVVAGDHGKVKRFTNSSAVTVTLPDGLSVGTLVELLFVGAGGGSVADNGTSTVNPTGSVSQHEAVSALVVAADVWSAVGPLS